MDSGLHASLHPNCHHQIVYAKLNLKIEYSPCYEQLVWDYKKTSIIQPHNGNLQLEEII